MKKKYLIGTGVILSVFLLGLIGHRQSSNTTVTYTVGDTIVSTSSNIPLIQGRLLKQAQSVDSCTVTVTKTENVSPTTKRTTTYSWKIPADDAVRMDKEQLQDSIDK